jgi:hypothetical protein
MKSSTQVNTLASIILYFGALKQGNLSPQVWQQREKGLCKKLKSSKP